MMQNKLTLFWPEIRLGDAAEISTPCTYPLFDWPDDHLQPVMTVAKLTDQTLLLAETKYVRISDRELVKFQLKSGDIVFNNKTSRNHVGKSLIFNFDEFVLHTKFLRIRPFPELDSQYLQLILSKFKAEGRIRKIAKVSNRLSTITCTELKNLRVPLPPLDVQRQILKGSETPFIDEQVGVYHHMPTLYR
jgi:restriction endonuclease S subunit